MKSPYDIAQEMDEMNDKISRDLGNTALQIMQAEEEHRKAMREVIDTIGELRKQIHKILGKKSEEISAHEKDFDTDNNIIEL